MEVQKPAEQEALALENKVNENHPDVLIELRKNMDQILSEVAGTPVKSIQPAAGENAFIWQFPVRRKSKKGPRSRSRSTRLKFKSRSRSKRKAKKRPRKSKTKTRISRSRPRPCSKRQFGGRASVLQYGGWRWFGWVRSPPSTVPATSQAAIAADNASTMRILMEKILASSIFRRAILVAASTWGLAKVVDTEFIATATTMVRNQVHQSLARHDYSATYGHILSSALKLQAQYLLAAITVTTAAAVVTRQLLRKRTIELIPEEPPVTRIHWSAEEHRRVAEAAIVAQRKAAKAAKEESPESQYLKAAEKNDYSTIKHLFDMHGVDYFARVLGKPFNSQVSAPEDIAVIRMILKAASSVYLDVPIPTLLTVYAEKPKVIKTLVEEFNAIAEVQPHLNCSSYKNILKRYGYDVTCRW